MVMEYVKDDTKLVEVIRILASHIEDTRKFYFSHLDLQISKENDPLTNLIGVFTIANRERRGFNTERLVAAWNSFQSGVEDVITECKKENAKQAHERFLRWLCTDVKETNQKTANLFLKWVVMFGDDFDLNLLDFSSWREYLHVPLDIWVTRLMVEKFLDIGTERYNQDFLKSTVPNFTEQSRKYFQIQDELGLVASGGGHPRIIVDELWLVGHLFCTYFPILCDDCWINGECTKTLL